MDIIARIKKLHILSERSNSTAEAASAAAKIQELCFNHNLELSTVLGTPDNQRHPYGCHTYTAKANRLNFGWHKVVFHAAAKTNFCQELYTTGTTRFTVVGQRHNFEVVIYMFEYLVGEIERLAKEYVAQQGFIYGKDKSSYIRSFCQGASIEVFNILQVNAEAREQSTTESTALVVVKGSELKAAVCEFFPHLGKAKAVSFRRGDGYNDGRAAARNISINLGIGSGKRNSLTD